MDASLLRVLRPGSRTILCHPSEPDFAIELARRGFRLMIVHEGSEFLEGLRASLRAEGLSSLLMGSTRAEVDQVPSLATGFYELAILSSRCELTMSQIKFALGLGGLLVQPSAQGEVDLAGLQSVDFPTGYVGGRVDSL